MPVSLMKLRIYVVNVSLKNFLQWSYIELLMNENVFDR